MAREAVADGCNRVGVGIPDSAVCVHRGSAVAACRNERCGLYRHDRLIEMCGAVPGRRHRLGASACAGPLPRAVHGAEVAWVLIVRNERGLRGAEGRQRIGG